MCIEKINRNKNAFTMDMCKLLNKFDTEIESYSYRTLFLIFYSTAKDLLDFFSNLQVFITNRKSVP